MAAAANPLEDLITCSVCLEIYNNPQQLSCLHTYCLRCVQGLNQQNRVKCPECRVVTNVRDVKKDFKTESLIDVHKNTTGKSTRKPTGTNKCDICEETGKAIEWFCSNCEELLCVDCAKAHRNMKATKSHKLTAFSELQKTKQFDFDKQVNLMRIEQTSVEGKMAAKREEIGYIHKQRDSQLAEVDEFENTLIEEVKQHHESLRKQICAINDEAIENLEREFGKLQEVKNEIEEKIVHLLEVSKDFSILIDLLKNLNVQIQEELGQIRSSLPPVDRHPKPLLTVVPGQDWDPQTSTQIEVGPTALVPGREMMASHTLTSTRIELGPTALVPGRKMAAPKPATRSLGTAHISGDSGRLANPEPEPISDEYYEDREQEEEEVVQSENEEEFDDIFPLYGPGPGIVYNPPPGIGYNSPPPLVQYQSQEPDIYDPLPDEEVWSRGGSPQVRGELPQWFDRSNKSANSPGITLASPQVKKLPIHINPQILKEKKLKPTIPNFNEEVWSSGGSAQVRGELPQWLYRSNKTANSPGITLASPQVKKLPIHINPQILKEKKLKPTIPNFNEESNQDENKKPVAVTGSVKERTQAFNKHFGKTGGPFQQPGKNPVSYTKRHSKSKE